MIYLFLAPLFLGRSLWPPFCLPLLAPIDFLADFIALPTALRVNILTIVFTTTLPMPPICLFLVPGDPLSDTDLLFEHDPLGDHDLLLEDLHDHLVLADIRLGGAAALPGLTLYQHPLDVYLLAPPRDPYHLTLGSHA